MSKDVKSVKSDLVTRGELIDSLMSQKAFNSKHFLNSLEGRRLNGKIDSIAGQEVSILSVRKEELGNGDVLLYAFLFLFVFVAGLAIYFYFSIQSIKNRFKHRSLDESPKTARHTRSQTIDWYAHPKTSTPVLPESENKRFKELNNELEELRSEIELIKKQRGNSELVLTPVEHKVSNQTILFFEPTVLSKSATGLSVFTAFEDVRMYEVFQLNVNTDGKTGTFFFNESLERGKNDVATELTKLFPFAEHEGSGSRTSFRTIKKGVARLVSGDQWEVVEKAKIEIT
jgi:hypothetical protein